MDHSDAYAAGTFYRLQRGRTMRRPRLGASCTIWILWILYSIWLRLTSIFTAQSGAVHVESTSQWFRHCGDGNIKHLLYFLFTSYHTFSKHFHGGLLLSTGLEGDVGSLPKKRAAASCGAAAETLAGAGETSASKREAQSASGFLRRAILGIETMFVLTPS